MNFDYSLSPVQLAKMASISNRLTEFTDKYSMRRSFMAVRRREIDSVSFVGVKLGQPHGCKIDVCFSQCSKACSVTLSLVIKEAERPYSVLQGERIASIDVRRFEEVTLALTNAIFKEHEECLR